jgi:hypothetical protein
MYLLDYFLVVLPLCCNTKILYFFSYLPLVYRTRKIESKYYFV